LTLFTAKRFGLAIPVGYYTALFFGSVVGYNVIKNLAEPWKFPPRKSFRSGVVFRLSVICLLAAILSLVILEWPHRILLCLTAVLSCLYAIPVFPGFRNLRSFGLLKIIIVGLVWTMLSYVNPLFPFDLLSPTDLFILGIQRFIWMMLLMIPFEIRDMAVDPPQLQTLPKRIGIKGTRHLGWMGVMLLILLSMYCFWESPRLVLLDFLLFMVTGFGIQFSSPKQSRYYASFWIESIPVWGFLLQILILKCF
jgi:hypothetical protein